MTTNEKTYWQNWRDTLDAYADECNAHTENAETTARLLADEFDKTQGNEINPFRALEVALEDFRKQLWDRMCGYEPKAAKVRDAMVAALETAARDYFPEIAAILWGESQAEATAAAMADIRRQAIEDRHATDEEA